MIPLNKEILENYSEEEGSNHGILPLKKGIFFSAREVSDLVNGSTIVRDDRCKCHPHINPSRLYFYFLDNGGKKVRCWATY